jgi:aryl-alcohol dehydrogenase-like predicted oxidoreductase
VAVSQELASSAEKENHDDDFFAHHQAGHAVESGVNWIDTAAVYGLGHSEKVVAAALTGIPEADRPYVFTKGGLVWDPADGAGTGPVGTASVAAPHRQ